MSQQQTDRELLLKRLREHFPRKDFSVNDSLLTGLDPHDALQLVAEAMTLELSFLSDRRQSVKWKLKSIFCSFASGLVFYFIFRTVLSRDFMPVCVYGVVCFSLFLSLIIVYSNSVSLQNAKRAILDLARLVHRQEALSSLLNLVEFLHPESDSNAHDAVEEAIYRILTETKVVSSVPLSEAQSDYLRELLLRSRQKDEVVVAVLLLLASARDAKLLPIAADLARSAPSEHVRMVAAEVYQELQ